MSKRYRIYTDLFGNLAIEEVGCLGGYGGIVALALLIISLALFPLIGLIIILTRGWSETPAWIKVLWVITTVAVAVGLISSAVGSAQYRAAAEATAEVQRQQRESKIERWNSTKATTGILQVELKRVFKPQNRIDHRCHLVARMTNHWSESVHVEYWFALDGQEYKTSHDTGRSGDSWNPGVNQRAQSPGSNKVWNNEFMVDLPDVRTADPYSSDPTTWEWLNTPADQVCFRVSASDYSLRQYAESFCLDLPTRLIVCTAEEYSSMLEGNLALTDFDRIACSRSLEIPQVFPGQ